MIAESEREGHAASTWQDVVIGMQRKSVPLFPQLRDRAWRIVSDWGAAISDDTLPPVHDLAVQYGVRAIRFERLLSTAAISRTADGFLVHLNNMGHGTEKPDGTMVDINADTVWSLPRQMRFSVAHEIAHAIFCTEAKNAGKASALSKNLPKLEKACNQLAGAMLLPKTHLVAKIGDQLFDAEVAKSFVGKYRVSAQVFIHRMRSPDLGESFSGSEGLLALLSRNGNDVQFEAVHTRGGSGSRWKKLAKDFKSASLRDLFLAGHLTDRLLTEPRIRELCDVVWHPAARQIIPCEITTQQVCTNPLKILVGIRVRGSPTVRPDSDLFASEKDEASDGGCGLVGGSQDSGIR